MKRFLSTLILSLLLVIGYSQTQNSTVYYKPSNCFNVFPTQVLLNLYDVNPTTQVETLVDQLIANYSGSHTPTSVTTLNGKITWNGVLVVDGSSAYTFELEGRQRIIEAFILDNCNRQARSREVFKPATYSYTNLTKDSLFIINSVENDTLDLALGKPETVTTSAVAGQTPTTNPPATPAEGDEFLNTTDNLAWIFDGTTWIPRPVPTASPSYSSAVIAAPYTGVELPVAAGTVVGQVRTQQFNDGQTVDYTWNGTAWVAGVVIDVTEQRICLNTATPVFTPANLLLPTLAEVNAWVAASTLTAVQKLNGTHLDYFIAGQGGSCDNPDYTWVLNEGSLLTTRVDNSILTVADYTALRALTNYNHDIVNVSDFTYVGPDGLTYTTLGGVFRRNNVAALTENGGTQIIGTDGTKWERFWDKIHVQPEWWVCGGYDHLGIIYTNKNTSTSGIYNERDRIQSAVKVGGVLELTPEKIYLVDRIILLNRDGDSERYTINGNKGILKRVDGFLTSVTSVAGNVITVADASRYRANQAIAVYTTQNDAGLMSYPTIISIVGNALTVTDAVGVAAGMNVVNVTTIFQNGTSVIGNNWPYELYIDNLIIDGNKANNDDVISFRVNYEIESISTRHISITNSEFTDIPTNCVTGGPSIYMGNVVVKNCDGSIYHQSNTGANQGGSYDPILFAGKYNNSIFEGLSVDNVGNRWEALGHEEAVFTASANTYRVKISDSNFDNVHSALISFGSPTQECVIDNVICKSAPAAVKTYLFNVTGAFSTKETPTIEIKNSLFDGFGAATFDGFTRPDESTAQNATNINIYNNTFVNSYFTFSHCSNVSLLNNKIFIDNTLPSYTRSFGTSINADNAIIYITRSQDFVISGNEIYGSIQTFVKSGITIRPINASTLSANYWDVSNMKISDNIIWGFTTGISFQATPFTNPYANKGTFGIEILNNKIVSGTTGNVYGLYGMPGSHVEGNRIWLRSSTASSFAIHSLGNNTNVTILPPTIIKDNYSFASDASRHIIIYDQNNHVEGNRMYQGLNLLGAENSGTNNYLSDNLRMDNLLPNYTGNTLLMPPLKHYVKGLGLVD